MSARLGGNCSCQCFGGATLPTDVQSDDLRLRSPGYVMSRTSKRARPRSELGQFASATGCRSDDPALQGWSVPQAQVQA